MIGLDLAPSCVPPNFGDTFIFFIGLYRPLKFEALAPSIVEHVCGKLLSGVIVWHRTPNIGAHHADV